jgi:hypothetical protein
MFQRAINELKADIEEGKAAHALRHEKYSEAADLYKHAAILHSSDNNRTKAIECYKHAAEAYRAAHMPFKALEAEMEAKKLENPHPGSSRKHG